MLNLFKSPLRIAKDNYHRCQEHRRISLLEFRKNAAREMLLLHPDAVLLMGTTFDSFLVYSKKSDIILVGRFNDKHFPWIDWVEDESVAEYELATNKYKKKLTAYSPYSGMHQKNLLENVVDYLLIPDEIKFELFTKGYYIIHEEKADLLIAARVSINDIPVAESSCVSPQSDGYFTKKIYNGVLLKEITSENGISAISLDLIAFDGGTTRTIGYEMLYDDSSNFKGDNGFNLFRKNFSGIIEFISSIEETIRLFPQGVDGKKEDWDYLLPELVSTY